jgi:hypothetical protein
MALADTTKAIGVVTELLRDRLTIRTSLPVTVGRIEDAATTSNPGGKKLNLFLYEALFDPSLKNVSLGQEQPPPLWLVLKYLLTAFDHVQDSDTVQAHENLGEGIRALQELSFLPLTTLPGSVIGALTDNPEPLKVTFEETPSDLLSRLMQGPDDRYRFSIGFQVRPVMIATREVPSHSLLVGIDYRTDPHPEIGEDGIQLTVTPSLGPQLNEVTPSKFEADPLQHAVLTLSGSDLNLSSLAVKLGPATLAIIPPAQPDSLRCRVDGGIADGRVISAGSHPLSVEQTLPTGRRRPSNLLIADLMPKLTKAGFQAPSGPGTQGSIALEGVLLGTEEDDILVSLYQDGRIVRTFDEAAVVPAVAATDPEQTELVLTLRTGAMQSGKYQVILRVNGQQAKASPEVDIP